MSARKRVYSMLTIVASAWLVAACGGSDPASDADGRKPRPEVVLKDSYRVLMAGLSPKEGTCGGLITGGFICDDTLEAAVAEQIALQRPDIVLLSQVASKVICSQLGADALGVAACKQRDGAAQHRRLVGPDYTIVCEPKFGIECVAIGRTVAEVKDCAAAGTCEDAMEPQDAPAGCDPLFTASAINLNFGLPEQLRLIHVHADSEYSGCASALISAVFSGVVAGESLVGTRSKPVLLAGDFGGDPFRVPTHPASVSLELNRQPDFSYVYGSDVTPPVTNGDATRELMLSNFVKGTCSFLGQDDGTVNLDGARYDSGSLATAAVLCDLKLHQ